MSYGYEKRYEYNINPQATEDGGSFQSKYQTVGVYQREYSNLFSSTSPVNRRMDPNTPSELDRIRKHNRSIERPIECNHDYSKKDDSLEF
ncbi:unnamed protein product [Sphagnum balticum]